MNVCLYVKIFQWWEQFLFFLFPIFFFFFFFFFFQDRHIDFPFYSLYVLPTQLSSFFRAWKTEERINSFFFPLLFLVLLVFFHYTLTATAHARLEKIFSLVSSSRSLCLSLYVLSALSSSLRRTLFSTATMCNRHLFVKKQRQV